MNIVVPLSKKEEVAGIIGAGANEVYCGVLDKHWRSAYIDYASVDRRPYPHACLKDYAELEEVTSYCRARNVPVYLTANEFYTADQFPEVISHIKKAVEAGVDGLIVADIPLLSWLGRFFNKKKIRIHVSGRSNVLNKQGIAFFKEMGAQRIILPRQLTLQEMEGLSSHADSLGMEIEVFILNLKCRFLDGFCTFYHESSKPVKGILKLRSWSALAIKGGFLSSAGRLINKKLQKLVLRDFFGCCMPYDVDLGGVAGNAQMKDGISRFFDLEPVLNGCGACSLYELKKMNIAHVKIIGRENSLDKKIRDINFIRQAIVSLDKDMSKNEFMRLSRDLFFGAYFGPCKPAYCYY